VSDTERWGATAVAGAVRNLVVVLGDQLNRDSAAFDGFDPAADAVWMAEAAEESTIVWVTKPRIAMFLAAMRHFAADLRAEGLPLDYRELGDPGNLGTLAAELAAAIERHRPERVVVVEAGEWRVRPFAGSRATSSTSAPIATSCARARSSLGSPRAVAPS